PSTSSAIASPPNGPGYPAQIVASLWETTSVSTCGRPATTTAITGTGPGVASRTARTRASCSPGREMSARSTPSPPVALPARAAHHDDDCVAVRKGGLPAAGLAGGIIGQEVVRPGPLRDLDRGLRERRAQSLRDGQRRPFGLGSHVVTEHARHVVGVGTDHGDAAERLRVEG